MKVFGVIDLAGGQAVHARGGVRNLYRPVTTIGGIVVEGDPARLARAYKDVFGVTDLYVADLDAIGGAPPSVSTLRTLRAEVTTMWLDAGTGTVTQALEAEALGVDGLVVGLETLADARALTDIAASLRHVEPVFSLDLRDGVPLGPRGHETTDRGAPSVETIVRGAWDSGFAAFIVLDLSRVGSSRGVSDEVIRRVRRTVPEAAWYAGGGITSADELRSLAAAGAAGVLVATALHEGRVTRTELHTILTR